MEEDLKKNSNLDQSITKLKSSNPTRWIISFIILMIIGVSIYFVFSQNLIQRAGLIVPVQSPVITNSNSITSVPAIDTSKNPVQTEIYETQSIVRDGKKGTISFIPMANYSVSAEVKSALNYDSDVQSEFIPTDLALAWGNLVDPELGKGIKYTQNGRWYFYTWDSTYPGDSLYIVSHSANHHIVPANETIKTAVMNIKEGQKVKIDGYLIDVEYPFSSGGGFYQSSSLTREDSGDGACELVYVTKLQIEDKVYE